MLIHPNSSVVYAFLLVSSVDFMTPITGVVPVVQVGKPSTALAGATNAPSEVGAGWYEVVLTALETNTIGDLRVVAIGAGAAPWRDVSQVDPSFAQSGNGAITFTYTLTNTVTLGPIPGASVWVTTDITGLTIVASGITDVFGQVVFYLDAGTYYFWRALAGFSFVNPDTEVV